MPECKGKMQRCYGRQVWDRDVLLDPGGQPCLWSHTTKGKCEAQLRKREVSFVIVESGTCRHRLLWADFEGPSTLLGHHQP